MHLHLAAIVLLLSACDSTPDRAGPLAEPATTSGALTAESPHSPKPCATSADCPAPQVCEDVVLLRRTERVCVPRKRLRFGSPLRPDPVATTLDATQTAD